MPNIRFGRGGNPIEKMHILWTFPLNALRQPTNVKNFLWTYGKTYIKNVYLVKSPIKCIETIKKCQILAMDVGETL